MAVSSHIHKDSCYIWDFLIRYVGLLGIIIGQFKLERTKPDAFFFISPIHRNSSGNGKDYQDAFSLNRNNLFSLCIHIGQRKHHLCLKFLKAFLSQMIQGEEYITYQILCIPTGKTELLSFSCAIPRKTILIFVIKKHSWCAETANIYC